MGIEVSVFRKIVGRSLVVDCSCVGFIFFMVKSDVNEIIMLVRKKLFIVVCIVLGV